MTAWFTFDCGGDHVAISMLMICQEAPTLSQEQDKVAETNGGDIGWETTPAMKAWKKPFVDFRFIPNWQTYYYLKLETKHTLLQRISKFPQFCLPQ